jgi:hypothetical protein
MVRMIMPVPLFEGVALLIIRLPLFILILSFLYLSATLSFALLAPGFL